MKKLLQREKVLTCGRGYRRAVLCYDSGLVYQYDDPSNITAQYVHELKGWVKLQPIHYNSGGWGRSASGPVDESILLSNTYSLLHSIDAKIYTLNQDSWVSAKDVITYNKKAEKQNRDMRRMAEKYQQSFNEFPKLEPIKISFDKSGTDKGLDVFTAIEKMKKAIDVFISGKGKQTRALNYHISKDLVIQDDITVAYRAKNGDIVMNSQVLNLTPFERAFLNSESIIQNEIKSRAKINIPFNVLESAGLKLNETKIIEQGPEETFTIQGQKRHFTGYVLLENHNRKFFMDIDRIEIQHGIFNVFFVEVDSSVKNKNEAYESMKPEAVKLAEKMKVEYKRQGEWFFLPTGKKTQVKEKNIFNRILRPEENLKYKDEITLQQFQISHGKGRPNTLFKVVINGVPQNEVCGVVCHSGREHKPLNLGYVNTEHPKNQVDMFERGYSYHNQSTDLIEIDLYTVIGNTTVSNFTITGDVD